MTYIRTHYDNLKVSRNAPPEVIRAAYKALSQRFHPDRNPGDTEAERIMVIINTSYEVLSNPEKRQKHDLWIKEQENEFRQHNPKPEPVPQEIFSPQELRQSTKFELVILHILRNWYLYVILALFLWAWATDKKNSSLPITKPYLANPITAQPAYIRPATAPNGNPWPNSAGYVNGYERLNTDGYSKVTVDNSQNNSDVFVKLVSLDSAQAYPVRQFYIPAFGKFTINKITAGNYDIRYRDLDNGELSRSENFNLEESQTEDGIQYSNFRMTLYKVRNGNMQTYGLSEAEF